MVVEYKVEQRVRFHAQQGETMGTIRSISGEGDEAVYSVETDRTGGKFLSFTATYKLRADELAPAEPSALEQAERRVAELTAERDTAIELLRSLQWDYVQGVLPDKELDAQVYKFLFEHGALSQPAIWQRQQAGKGLEPDEDALAGGAT